jgi:hypothetical protein
MVTFIWRHHPLIDVNLFRNNLSISELLNNQILMNTAYNFTNFIRKLQSVAKNSEHQQNYLLTIPELLADVPKLINIYCQLIELFGYLYIL